MTLQVRLRHRFADGQSLDLSLQAPLPGIVGLFGPSGAGKSTLVSALCGVFRPDWSEIRLGDRVLSGPGTWLRPEARRIGTVFQDGRLFPHLSVTGNLRYGARRAPASAEGPGFDEVVALLGIETLLRRRTRALSGGERQRVAIGRALLSRPALLAMDEPLSGLDDARRAEILPFLLRLRARAGLPILYVTHRRDEAMQLCDTLALVEAGRVVGCGPAAAMLSDGPMAERPDAAALLEGVVAGHEAERGLTRIDAGGLVLSVALLPCAVGTPLRLSVPAREVVLLRPDGAAPRTSAQNALPMRVRAVRPVGDAEAVVVLEPRPDGGAALLSRVTRDSVARLGLAPGIPLLALVKSSSVSVLDREERG